MSSKIKVDTIENVAGSGNVSLGSGHNLVVPGNNSTTGNATVGGTLGVTGATTTAGITSSAAHTVTTTTHANASVFKTTGHTQLFLQDTDTSANLQFWGLQNSGGDFNILRCNDDRASGFVTPMTIHQEGYVVMPSQPHVRATVASGTTAITFTSNVNTTVPYNQILENNGSHFNTGNHLFTCPVSGVYAVYAAIQASNVVQASNQVGPNLSIQRNSTRTSGTYDWVAQAAYKKLECTAFIKCSANDTLAINLYDGANSTSGTTEFNGDARNILMVTLLG